MANTRSLGIPKHLRRRSTVGINHVPNSRRPGHRFRYGHYKRMGDYLNEAKAIAGTGKWRQPKYTSSLLVKLGNFLWTIILFLAGKSKPEA